MLNEQVNETSSSITHESPLGPPPAVPARSATISVGLRHRNAGDHRRYVDAYAKAD